MATAASLVDSTFHWDGTSSDIATQLYRRFQANATVPKLSISTASLPQTIQTRLKAVRIEFDKLPGLLQRALVWDSGYVQNGKHTDQLVRVRTVGGVSMAEIAVSVDDYETKTKCSTAACVQPDQRTWLQNQNCSSASMLKATHCVVDSFDSGENAAMAMWSTGGVDETIPEIRLLKHYWNQSGTLNVVAAIHTAEASAEPPYGYCSKDSASVTAVGSLVIPCEIGSSTKGQLAQPKQSELVTAWLKEYAQGTPTPDGATDTTIIIVACAAAVGLIVLGLLIWCRRRRAQAKQATESQAHDQRQVTARQDGAHFLSLSSPQKYASTNGGTGQGSVATRPSSFDETNEAAYHATMRTLLSEPSVAEKQVEYDEIEFADLVSKGAYGEVWVGYWNREIVALKRLLRSKHQTPDDIRAFALEIQLSARLHHPNIVRFIGVSWDGPEDLCMVMEILPAGDLAKVLRENGRQLTWNQHKLGMARGLASAVSYLHGLTPAIIHRDLKSKNVLLTNTLEPKIIDFGVSRRKMDDTMTAGVGTPYWTAPEVLEGTRYTEKSDIYSLGVLLTELDTCQIPYFDVKNETGGMIHLKILNDVVSGKLRPSVTPSCPSFIRDTIDACLRPDPASRPTAAEVLWMLA